MELMIRKFFIIRHWCEVWVCANDPVCINPCQHKLLQNLCTMREIFFVIFLIYLVPCRLNNPEQHHNPWPLACRILDIRPIIWLPVHCHIHLQTQMYTTTKLFLPPWYVLIITDDIQRREELCEILIKISKKIFKNFPPMSLMYHTLILQIWLMAP